MSTNHNSVDFLKDINNFFLIKKTKNVFQKNLGAGVDVLRWQGTGNGLFSVSSFYQILSWETVVLFPRCMI